jgi:phosphoribosylformylglycinamidine synthase II
MPEEAILKPIQAQVPAPVAITPALLKTHSITGDEYDLLVAKLGRTPSLTELGIFSVMWSEHCSYKSSRVHLKRLPTRGTRLSGPGSVIQGPGENAGIIDVGDGWACAFKIESHNHPSYIEPYQGAATGVGGILRDIFTMGARPLAVMDSLRFGPLQPPAKTSDSSSSSEAGAPSIAVSSQAVDSTSPDPTDYARNRQTMRGVVAGVAGYGNCFGVPNLGGETRFEPCYSGNPLLNAFALGLVRTNEIFYAKAEGVGNPVFYVGAKTGRDGIHGATMASEEFTEGSEQKRPNVQMGDPFLEKLLLEACLEVMKTGAVLGIQDMGAAGLTCSTCEMGARGNLGVTIELDKVPQRETGMTTYEIMLSESQERMLLVAEKGREVEVIAVFTKWGLDCAEVGTVTADDMMRVYHGGVLEAEIPNKALTDEAPVYHRPVGTWNPPVPKDPPAWVLEELQKPRDYTADLLKLLASPNICSKAWVYEQYDSMVQTNTVQGPGGEAGVMRIKGTGSAANVSPQPSSSFGDAGGSASVLPAAEHPAPHHTGFLGKLADLIASSTPKGEATLATGSLDAANPVVEPGPEHESFPAAANGLGASSVPASSEGMGSASSGTKPKPERGLAMALAGNGRWCYLDPKLGAMHAVAEAARKVACTGATPVAATNCLNFGNPQKPEIMAQLSAAIDGIAEACTALGTPVTGGNVSLYNETLGEGIYPTPVIGVVGILDDVTKAVPSGFQRAGDCILLCNFSYYPEAFQDFGSSEFAVQVLGEMWGTAPWLEIDFAADLQRFLPAAIATGLVRSCCDIGSGGLVVALAKASLYGGFGCDIKSLRLQNHPEAMSLFAEGDAAILTCAPDDIETLKELATRMGVTYCDIGLTTYDRFRFSLGAFDTSDSPVLIETSVSQLLASHTVSLETQLAEEVHA